MSKSSKQADWPLHPFDPECRKRTAYDPLVVEAVRLILTDWDGGNWSAVEMLIRNGGIPESRLRTMTPFHVRMFCNIRPAVVPTGNCATATVEVTRLETASQVIDIEEQRDYVPAAVLELEHHVTRNRLSEAATAGLVRTKEAPPGMRDVQGGAVRKLYHKRDALKHCCPERILR